MNRIGYVLKKAFGTIEDPGECLLTLWIFLTLSAIFGSALYQNRPLFVRVDDLGLFALYIFCIVHLYGVLHKYILESFEKPA